MNTKTRFLERKQRALSAAEFAKVTDRSGTHIRGIVLPGHESKQYKVFLKYFKDEIELECNLVTSSGFVPCKGSYSGVCYHSIAAIIKAAKETEKSVSFCTSEKDALSVSKLNSGKVYKLSSSRNSERNLWVVVSIK